jgi:N-acetylated-alpha-linked acidic dipeptidase
MGGPLAETVGGKDFCGGIHNLTYRVGPSQALAHLVVQNKDVIRKIPNVVGHIPGTLAPEQDMPVLLGNHRDAWVYGAADPNSGTAALLEVAKGLGVLYRDHGWRPIRSIYLLSWSGEEYGLLGSTGWAELHAIDIRRALVYLNVDTVVSGDILTASASPSLTTLWMETLQDLNTTGDHCIPFANEPLGDIRDANTDWKWSRKSPTDEIRILGSGSDYTVFLDHLGIPSLDFSFGKTTTYGQYHSIYDSFSWMDRYGGHDLQPGSSFDLIAFASKIWGLLALRLATSPLVLLDHVAQGVALSSYVAAIKNQNTTLDLSELEHSVQYYRESAASLQVHCQTPEDLTLCNEKLGLTERCFLMETGLPGRPWFKHSLQAPGQDLGYAAEAFPGIQEAINNKNWSLARAQVDAIANLVANAAAFLKP